MSRTLAAIAVFALIGCGQKSAPVVSPPGASAPQSPAPVPSVSPATPAVMVRAPLSCLDDARALVKAHAVGDVTVLDTRSRAAFDRGHIRGALWVAAYRLQLHPAAREPNTRVIVDEASGRARRDAKTLGLEVLAGGMAAWCRVGGPVDGSCDGADEVAAEAAWGACGCPDRAVVVTQATPLLPGARVAETAEGLRAVVLETGARMVLVAAHNAKARQALQKAARTVDAHVLFVKGDLAGFDALAQRQTAMANRRQLVSAARTAQRPQARAALNVPKGCGCR